MKRFKRVFLVVLDSVGVGEAPDAKLYGDVGSHTLGHIAEQMNGLNVPTLEQLGLGLITPIKGIKEIDNPLGYVTKMAEKSVGKDTMTGHWELMGLHTERPFKTFPNGFPESLIKELEQKINRPIIGNKVASGTAIIEELGQEQIEKGGIIVYTSADSVLQIAAHEDVVPLEELYAICETARKLTLVEQFRVGRVIARPFIGDSGQFIRTANRHDYAVKPFAPTVMDYLKNANFDVISLGKINDIFDGEGITKAIRTVSNDDGMDKLMIMIEEKFHGLCFLNLVDFDALYGHRRDPIGYGQAIERFDEQLAPLLDRLNDDDLLIITADHGNDPTFRGTDHTREFVPLIVYHKGIYQGARIQDRTTFADVGATIAHNFNVQNTNIGTSFLTDILT